MSINDSLLVFVLAQAVLYGTPLLYAALGKTPPQFYHCPLMTDAHGERLAKRHDALSLRTLRDRGVTPQEIIASFTTGKPVIPA